jgi:hypothetical protein
MAKKSANALTNPSPEDAAPQSERRPSEDWIRYLRRRDDDPSDEFWQLMGRELGPGWDSPRGGPLSEHLGNYGRMRSRSMWNRAYPNQHEVPLSPEEEARLKATGFPYPKPPVKGEW